MVETCLNFMYIHNSVESPPGGMRMRMGFSYLLMGDE